MPGLNSVADVRVELFTTAFRKVKDQSFPQQPAGVDAAIDLKDDWGTPLASGLYYVVVFSANPSTGSGQTASKSIGKLLIVR